MVGCELISTDPMPKLPLLLPRQRRNLIYIRCGLAISGNNFTKSGDLMGKLTVDKHVSIFLQT